jgi:hypothetical protein
MHAAPAWGCTPAVRPPGRYPVRLLDEECLPVAGAADLWSVRSDLVLLWTEERTSDGRCRVAEQCYAKKYSAGLLNRVYNLV